MRIRIGGIKHSAISQEKIKEFSMPKKKKLKKGGRIKPAKCRNGIAKKGKTRGVMV